MRLAFLFLFVTLSGCSLLVAKPRVDVKRVTISTIDNRGMGIDFLVSVANPNSYKLNLDGYRYDLSISSISAAKGESDDRVELPGNAVTDVNIPLRLEFADLRKILKGASDPGKIPYSLNAELDIRTPLGPFTLPMEKDGTFSLPRNFFVDLLLKKLK